jgi:hypothetical protein
VREFKDSEGRPWRVALTVASAGRVKDLVRVVLPPKSEGDPPSTEAVPFDLIDAGEIARTFQVLRSNFLALGETLYAILLPDAESRGVSREAFLDGMSGDSLEAGGVALEEELVSFFPPRLRGVVSSLAARMTELAAELTTQAEAALRSMPGTSSGPQPESSASIPGSGPSGN